jgi:tetratricopeptide (TPR) repeat protein
MRISELENMKINSIKGDILTIVGKGDKERTVYLNDLSLKAVEQYLQVRNNYSISGDRMFNIANDEIRKVVKKYISSYDGERLNIVINEQQLEGVETRESYEADEYYDNAVALYEESRNLEALKFCNGALAQGYETDDMYNLKGLILYELYQYDDALKCYFRALKINPDLSEVYYNQALIYEEIRDFDNAIKHYDNYLKCCPHNPEANFAKGQIFIMVGKWDAAAECFESVTAAQPHNMVAYRFLAAALWNVGRLEEALNSIEKVIEQNPLDINSIDIKTGILEDIKGKNL